MKKRSKKQVFIDILKSEVYFSKLEDILNYIECNWIEPCNTSEAFYQIYISNGPLGFVKQIIQAKRGFVLGGKQINKGDKLVFFFKEATPDKIDSIAIYRGEFIHTWINKKYL